jgi:uncharacterized protein YlxW (UPF0749 family)
MTQKGPDMKTTSKVFAAGTVAVVGWGLLVSGIFVTKAEMQAANEKQSRQAAEEFARKEDIKEVLREIQTSQKEMQKDLEEIKINIARHY